MHRWKIREFGTKMSKIRKYESIMTQGNGYMGIRNSLSEKYPDGVKAALINGVFNTPNGDVSELAILPDVTGIEISIGEEKFSSLFCDKTDYIRELDMRTGESFRQVIWTPANGGKFQIIFKRIVSDVKEHIIAEKITVKALQGDGEFEVKTGIDGKITNCGVQHFGIVRKLSYKDGSIGVYTETLQSKVGIAVSSHIICDAKKRLSSDRRSIFQSFNFKCIEGESFTFEKISSYTSSRDFEYRNSEVDVEKVRDDSLKYLSDAVRMGYDALCEESTNSWNEFWKEKEIKIETDDEFYAQAVNFAIYHLHIMANRKDNRLGIGAKALTGEGYKGHSFWDTEMFILPYYIYNEPETARNLLEYRYNLLNSACEKAKEYGYEGAMYPWECAWIDDGETCPKYGELDMGTGEVRENKMCRIEVHLNAAVAYGVYHYFLATNDIDFMKRCGYEIIILTGLFWTSRAKFVNGRYEILDVIGPDEYKDNIDNNAYTNYMAQLNMSLAAKYIDGMDSQTYSRLNKKHNLSNISQKLKKVLDGLYLPKPNKDGIIEQFDDCMSLKEIDTTPYKNNENVCMIFEDYKHSDILKMKVFKQADTVMLMYARNECFTDDIIKKNLDYYEKFTLHDSSLSMCIHALVAARVNNLQMADNVFRDALSVDIGENVNNSDIGIHAASIGGIWLALVMGYGGMCVDEYSLSFAPKLPKHIEKYQFRILYKGSKLLVTVDKSGANIIRESGEPVKLKMYDKEITI